MKLLVTDYDNTLEFHYDHTDNENILKRNILSLSSFMKNNIVCIATGRHFDAIYNTLNDNGIQFNYLCANNGAELYDNKYNLLFCLPIDEHDLKILKKLTQKVFFRNPCNSELIASANLYLDDIDVFEEVKKYLNNNLKESFIEYKFPKIKIINKRCNKVNVIDIIKNMEQLSDNNIYTIGDDVNDFNMILKYNGYSLTTACEKVRKIALKTYDELNQFINYIE